MDSGFWGVGRGSEGTGRDCSDEIFGGDGDKGAGGGSWGRLGVGRGRNGRGAPKEDVQAALDGCVLCARSWFYGRWRYFM